MNRWQKSLMVIFTIVALLIAIAFMLPSQWVVQRSVIINAKAEAIFPLINNLHRWPEWTPWNHTKDHTSIMVYSGPEQGMGATVDWNGEKMGEGSLTITSSNPLTGIYYGMVMEEFHEPVQGSILLSPEGNGIKVTWRDEGSLGNNPFHRYFGLMIDRMLGTDFKKGLAKLKQIVENIPQ